MDTGIINKITSRKFILTVLTLLSATTLCFTGNIADGVYSTVVIASVGAYITGNVLQKNQINDKKD